MIPEPTDRLSPSGRLSWLEPIALTIAQDAGLESSIDLVEDMVVLAYEGILNDPTVKGVVTYQLLMSRSRNELSRWSKSHQLTDPSAD